MFPPHPHIFLMHFFYQTAHIHQDCTARNSHLFFFLYIPNPHLFFSVFDRQHRKNKYIPIYKFIYTVL